MPKVMKSQLIEVVNPGVAGGGNQATKIQFPDQPYLRGKRITGIEIFTVTDISASPSGKTPITAADMIKSFLTLYLDDPADRASGQKNVGEWIQSVPFTSMHRVQNGSNEPFVRQMFELTGQVIYWEKCYISLATALANTSDKSFLFQVYFQ